MSVFTAHAANPLVLEGRRGSAWIRRTPAVAPRQNIPERPREGQVIDVHHWSSAVSATVMVADLPTVINNATAWVVGILATLATFYLTLGGLRYMAAEGNPSDVERAKSSLRSAGIGYALALLAPVVLTVLKKILGV